MYLLASSLTGSRPAATVAGVLFVFVPFRAQEAGHLQSLMYGWMPIGLWALHRYFATGKYFCRSTSTILAGFGRLLVRRRTVRWALLRVLKTQKTKRRERPLGDVHGVR